MTTVDLENQINMLERQLDRERRGRKKAEEVLRTKSIELHHKTNKVSVIAKRLEHALLAGNEDIFEYDIASDRYQMFKTLFDTDAKIVCAVTLSGFIDTIHNDDRTEFCMQWDKHLNGLQENVDITIRALMPEQDEEYRWCQIRGRKVLDKESGKPSKIIGTVKDCHEQYQSELSYKTISQTYLLSKQPSCIIDYSTKHVVTTDSFQKMLAGLIEPDSAIDANTLSQEDLREILPISMIKLKQKEGVSVFRLDLNLGDKSVSCFASIPPLMQENNELGQYRYVVLMFKPA